ncbi:DNA repair protein RecN [Egicoccus halophilus]|uniref:DNA repair protein RecN n=1 Tax=Egicoccus halophilus TaxID=1670830 RepID=A0A8J3ETC5_9ACTN|nr:DNA repair protein RecN [Egicoccus halophilus]GGI04929.1 DNA repair protein RecN [Egicoccus halophilus]
MLDELHIRGLGVIEDAVLQLAPGLTVVTGETGAGKTMVVTALQLLLGARADTALVRSGEPLALAEAVVSPPPAEAGEWMHPDDEVLIVSREIPASGRSRARIGGRLAPVSVLADVLGRHVEVHAQHEHVRLARPEVQRALLDRFAGEAHARTLQHYADAYGHWRELAGLRERLEQDARERARDLDRLRFEVEEIDAAELDPTADADLDRQLDLLANAEQVQLAAATAAQALGSDGAGEPVGVALDALRRLDVTASVLDELRTRAEAVAVELAELSADVRDFGDGVQADPQRLAELQQRRALLTSLQRKYGVDLAAVLGYADEARARLDALERADADADDLDARLDAATTELQNLAEDVHRGRGVAAVRLSTEVDRHLADLGMPHARFTVEVAAQPDTAPTRHGTDRITFLLAANPGEPARPLAQAASGGERSRVSLAVEVALADVDDARVLVFDEVDAGIGGATALAVGEKLARLAHGRAGRGRQVLCVTHLAQLAAFADVHHVVEKGLAAGRTVTTTRRVADDDRAGELARMLGGDATAEAGLDHARELLATAEQRRAG